MNTKVAVPLSAVLGALIGCSSDRPAQTPHAVKEDVQTVGEEVGEGVEKAGDKVEEGTDKVREKTRDEPDPDR